MHHSIRRFSALACIALSLTACSKKETVATTDSTKTTATATTASFDTTAKVEEVPITDTTHRLFFRPAVGASQRFHVVDRINLDVSDQGVDQTRKQSMVSTTEYYLTQTVKSVNPKDSSIELTVHIDTIISNSARDTAKINYSSLREADRKDEKFREFNIVLGKPFTIRTNKYGDILAITDASAIEKDLVATVPPDTLKKYPQIRTMVKEQSQSVLGSYIARVSVHCPTRPLVKDTTWRNAQDVNINLAEGLSFPVRVEATETVKGLEKRGNKVVAVLEDRTSTTPKKTSFEEGPTKATLSNFSATSHGLAHIEDATGWLMHRTLEEKRSFMFTIESKQSKQKRVMQQSSSETLTVEQSR